nr:RNA-directed DNA polymerase, eukaryota [Tanacetum cinerariifolium]
QAWNSFSHSDPNRLIRFKKKLQDLKKTICIWIKDKKALQSGAKRVIIEDLAAIDKRLDCGAVFDKSFIDGDWITDSKAVKDAFRDHFAFRFKKPVDSRLKLNIQFPNRLSSEQVEILDSGVSRAEIRDAVWGCGVNKSPGPDGFTFEFFRRYWNFLDDTVFIGKWSENNLFQSNDESLWSRVIKAIYGASLGSHSVKSFSP